MSQIHLNSRKNTRDRRFEHPAWEYGPFAELRSIYQQAVHSACSLIQEYPFLSSEAKEVVSEYTNAFWEILCPALCPWANPKVMEETYKSQGENWSKSLINIQKYLDKKDLLCSLANSESCELGKTIATTPGYVIARTSLCEILYYPPPVQYHKRQGLTPILIIPSWINKFYILDLTPEDSFIRWISAHKFPVLVISWRNPLSVKDIGLEDYVYSAAQALSLVQTLFGVKPHLVGHCAGGLLMSLAVAYAQQAYGVSPCTMTYLTNIFDFRHIGRLKTYLERISLPSPHNLISGEHVRNLFLSLKSNDLMWPTFVDRYYLGKEGSQNPVFYWNDDPMNIQPKLHQEFLDLVYKNNLFLTEDSIKIKDKEVSPCMHKEIPSFVLAAQTDHLVPWKSCYAGVEASKGCTFVLSQAGHIAGVITHPKHNKYGYWEKGCQMDPDVWIKTAEYKAGSWWPRWMKWISSRTVITESLAHRSLITLGNTPGHYVTIRYDHKG